MEIKEMLNFFKNPRKNYVQWFYDKKRGIDSIYQDKPKALRLNIRFYAPSPYYDDLKNEIVLPIYTLLDLALLPFLPLFIVRRIWYLYALPAIYAHELSHSTRKQKHKLAKKQPTLKNFILSNYYFFTDKELRKEEKIASREALEAVKAIDEKMYSLNPFYVLNEATLLGIGKRED